MRRPQSSMGLETLTLIVGRSWTKATVPRGGPCQRSYMEDARTEALDSGPITDQGKSVVRLQVQSDSVSDRRSLARL